MNENDAMTKEYSTHPASIVAGGYGDMAKELDDTLVEQIWQDLSGQVSRAQIHQVATEVAANFLDAKVRTFVPIFIRRQTRERLREGLNDQAQVA